MGQFYYINMMFTVKEHCREELLKADQEKEQQASLALEEAELQKAALQAENEAKIKDLLLELESTRTVSLFIPFLTSLI